MNALSRCFQTYLSSGYAKALLISIALAGPYLAYADDAQQDSSSGIGLIKMKMAETLNSLIEQGTATLNSMRRTVYAEPAEPTVVTLKMDKINSRFVAKEDQVYDRFTNLTWSRCSLGQRWVKSHGCVGTVRQVRFDQAQRFANEQWRLPTNAELATLIDRSKKHTPDVLAIDSVAFPDMDLRKLYYWTSTEEDNSFAWAVLFVDTGIPSILYRDHRYALRLVHSGV